MVVLNKNNISFCFLHNGQIIVVKISMSSKSSPLSLRVKRYSSNFGKDFHELKKLASESQSETKHICLQPADAFASASLAVRRLCYIFVLFCLEHVCEYKLHPHSLTSKATYKTDALKNDLCGN